MNKDETARLLRANQYLLAARDILSELGWQGLEQHTQMVADDVLAIACENHVMACRDEPPPPIVEKRTGNFGIYRGG